MINEVVEENAKSLVDDLEEDHDLDAANRILSEALKEVAERRALR